jgi:hypothetical protein
MTNARPQTGTGAVMNMPGGHGHGTASQRRNDDRSSTTLAALSAALRDQGVARANGNGDAWWRSCCDAAIAHLAAGDVPFSADHVLELIPEPDHPCRIGARFHAAVRAGVIRPVGYVLSDRPSRRRGVQRLYRGGAAR